MITNIDLHAADLCAAYAKLLTFCGFVGKNTKFSFNNSIQFIGEELAGTWKL